jgi:hypothetical protein
MLNSTWPGLVGETYSISPAGSGLYPFQDNAATIYTIANARAMLVIGQERSREETALAAVCLGVIATVRLQRKVFI